MKILFSLKLQPSNEHISIKFSSNQLLPSNKSIFYEHLLKNNQIEMTMTHINRQSKLNRIRFNIIQSL